MFLLKLFVFLGILYFSEGEEGLGLSCDCGWTKKPKKAKDIDDLVNGENSIIGEFPYIVYIQISQIHSYIIGSGAIINKRYAVTAASFLYSYFTPNPEDITLIHGLTNIRSKRLKWIPRKYKKKVVEIIEHPDFELENPMMNDIAILKVSGYFPMDKSNLGPACLPMQDERIVKKIATVAGWGATRNNRPYGLESSLPESVQNLTYYTSNCLIWGPGKCFLKPTNVLHKVNLTIETNLKECNKKWKKLYGKEDIFQTDKPTQICTDDIKSKKSICWGDYGAPMVKYDSDVDRYILIGLGQAFGNRLRKKKFKGCQGLNAFVNVAKYVDWIESVVKGHGYKVCKKTITA